MKQLNLQQMIRRDDLNRAEADRLLASYKLALQAQYSRLKELKVAAIRRSIHGIDGTS